MRLKNYLQNVCVWGVDMSDEYSDDETFIMSGDIQVLIRAPKSKMKERGDEALRLFKGMLAELKLKNPNMEKTNDAR